MTAFVGGLFNCNCADAFIAFYRVGFKYNAVLGEVDEVVNLFCGEYCVTDVTFSVLSDEEIDYYIEHYRPMDKAGSYGIQEWIGFVGVESISGSYFNVMGLPIQRLYTELKKL